MYSHWSTQLEEVQILAYCAERQSLRQYRNTTCTGLQLQLQYVQGICSMESNEVLLHV